MGVVEFEASGDEVVDVDPDGAAPVSICVKGEVLLF